MGNAGGKLPGFPGNSGGKADDSTNDSHGDYGSAARLAALHQQRAKSTEASAHYGGCPGGAGRTAENLSHVLTVEE
jgi:hypothetical protein